MVTRGRGRGARCVSAPGSTKGPCRRKVPQGRGSGGVHAPPRKRSLAVSAPSHSGGEGLPPGLHGESDRGARGRFPPRRGSNRPTSLPQEGSPRARCGRTEAFSGAVKPWDSPTKPFEAQTSKGAPAARAVNQGPGTRDVRVNVSRIRWQKSVAGILRLHPVNAARPRVGHLSRAIVERRRASPADGERVLRDGEPVLGFRLMFLSRSAGMNSVRGFRLAG